MKTTVYTYFFVVWSLCTLIRPYPAALFHLFDQVYSSVVCRFLLNILLNQSGTDTATTRDLSVLKTTMATAPTRQKALCILHRTARSHIFPDDTHFLQVMSPNTCSGISSSVSSTSPGTHRNMMKNGYAFPIPPAGNLTRRHVSSSSL